MRSFLILLFCGFLMVSVTYRAECAVPREEAIQIVIDSILEGDTADICLYMDPDTQPEGRTMTSDFYHYSNPYPYGWFFFIDDCPAAYWAHPCRYIFLSDARYYSVSREMWFPNSWAYFEDTLELIIPGGKSPTLDNISLTLDTLSMEEAIEFVINSVLEGDTTGIILYIDPYPGDSMVSSWNYSYINPYQRGWFFFIDDCPAAYWEHPCRFVFLNDVQYYSYQWWYCTIIREMSPPDNFDSLEQVIPVGVQEYVEPKTLLIYPNPFSTTTAITLSGYQATMSNSSIARSPNSQIALNIYDLSGRLISSLPITDYRSPITEVTWDGRDMSGKEVQSGVYFLRVKGNKSVRDAYRPVKVVKLR